MKRITNANEMRAALLLDINVQWRDLCMPEVTDYPDGKSLFFSYTGEGVIDLRHHAQKCGCSMMQILKHACKRDLLFDWEGTLATTQTIWNRDSALAYMKLGGALTWEKMRLDVVDYGHDQMTDAARKELAALYRHYSYVNLGRLAEKYGCSKLAVLKNLLLVNQVFDWTTTIASVLQGRQLLENLMKQGVDITWQHLGIDIVEPDAIHQGQPWIQGQVDYLCVCVSKTGYLDLPAIASRLGRTMLAVLCKAVKQKIDFDWHRTMHTVQHGKFEGRKLASTVRKDSAEMIKAAEITMPEPQVGDVVIIQGRSFRLC